MNRKKAKSEGYKVVIIGLILILLVGGYYFYLSNKNHKTEEEPVKITAVQEALLYNFDRNYPPTPKEVVKLYGKMTQCFYNEEYTDEEFKELALKIENLYDDELIANKTQDQYLQDLKWDINNFKEQEIVISSCAVSSSADVDYYSVGENEFARLYCTFNLRKGTTLGSVEEVFLLRKDQKGHWKIYGFKLANDANNIE